MTNDAALPLPELQDTILDAATVHQLFLDIGESAELLQILLKGGESDHASAGGVTLEEARQKLASGAVWGVQLRYRHGGAEWWDTLLRVPAGVRLVRIEHPAGG